MNPESASPAVRSAAELRRNFLDFFVARGHTAVPSAPLVPNDPSLLFTTAGMVQFKPYYTATADVPYNGRAVSVQKCLRLTDLDNVGLTPRHDTFFEMLGNFSFGPAGYFKEEAIAFAWEFLTEVLAVPVDRLYVSVFAGEGKLPRDDEAVALWKKIGLPADRIVALGRADNFWGPAGGRGACGPCSEIYFDLGEKRPPYLPDDAFWGERPGDAGDRYMEFWNLVFPQFDAQPDGTLVPLPRPGIDTGMGIERLAMVVQGRMTIFETDLFEPLVSHVLSLAGAAAARRPASLRDARIITDHTRALTFAIAEGALPGNEGAGYVLRRLLRRAVTRGRSQRSLAIDRTFLAGCAEQVIDHFGGHYRELVQHRDEILKVLNREEATFVETFEAGLARLDHLLAGGARRIAGEEAFALHDTYGFPVELVEEFAGERGVTVDREGFDRAMEQQRKRARAASKFERGADAGDREVWTSVTEGADSEFVGYQALSAANVTLRRWRPHGEDEVELVLDRTPFYAESGGQVADRGRIEAIGITAQLEHVHREGESIVHRARITNGDRESLISAGARGGLKAVVDPAHRFPTMRHHTATHLLHAALRQALGTHVRQAGSLVAPDRLRFDYTHFEAPGPGVLEAIERLVMEWVLRNREVSWEVMPLDDAKKLGAMALFGEKYGAQVRVVTVPGVEDAGIPTSRELCGGTHVRRTGDIGAFTLVSDSTIASGVRRIEALCGHEALRFFKAKSETLERAAALFQSRPDAVPEQIEKLRAEIERLKKQSDAQQKAGLQAQLAARAKDFPEIGGIRYFVEAFDVAADQKTAREAGDQLRGLLKKGVAIVAFKSTDFVTVTAVATDDFVDQYKFRMDSFIKEIAPRIGGGGGGKPTLAVAGGKDVRQVEAILKETQERIEKLLRDA